MSAYNVMTPIDESKTRYFCFLMRNFAPDIATANAWEEDGASVRWAQFNTL